MSSQDHSRNYDVQPGYRLQDVVDLPGWEEHSIWGWDECAPSFYAELCHNDSTSGEPELLLAGGWSRPGYRSPGCIALGIVEHTHAAPLAVIQAMGIAHPAPELRPDRQLVSMLSRLIAGDDPSPASMGRLRAMAWVLGVASESPGQHATWLARPTSAEVDAEWQLVVGRIHRGVDPAGYSGADAALRWALRR